MSDSLATLQRLRRLASDEARRDLAARVASVSAAEARLNAAQAALTDEALSCPSDAADPLAGSFALWLPAAQARRFAAAAAARTAEAEVAAARAALAEARAAARAVEVIADERAVLLRQDGLRRAQVLMDDLSGNQRK
jgi:hypothetical protein